MSEKKSPTVKVCANFFDEKLPNMELESIEEPLCEGYYNGTTDFFEIPRELWEQWKAAHAEVDRLEREVFSRYQAAFPEDHHVIELKGYFGKKD